MDEKDEKATPRRGGPRVGEACSRVSAWIPESTHDRLSRIALKQGTSVSAVVRQLLIVRLTGGSSC